MEFAGGGKVEPLIRGGHDARAASALDGVGGVVMIRGRELPELRPEFGGQVPLVEGEPSVGYGWLKGFDAVFLVLVLFVIHDSVLKAVSLFHSTEGVVG